MTNILVSIAGLAVTIWLFFHGVKTTQNLFKEYSQKRQGATFNYYTQLSSFITGLEWLNNEIFKS